MTLITVQLAAWENEARGPHGEWVSAKTGISGPFYHGSRYRLKVGDILEGGKFGSNQGYGQPGQHVYVTKDLNIAGEFAGYAYGRGHNKNAQPHVYEVEPVEDDIEKDPDEIETAQSYRSKKMRVTRVMPRVQWIAGYQRATEMSGLTAEDRAWIELGWHFDPLEHRNAHGEWAVNGAPDSVTGSPSTARHVVVYVPGTGSATPAGREGTASHIRGLRLAMDAAGRGSTAVVSWGYRAPGTLHEALGKGYAEATAGKLRDYVASLKAANPDAHVTVIGHSYGSVVAGMAAKKHGMRPDDLVFIGSPGVTARHASELGVSRDHIWAGDDSQDPIGRLATVLSPDFHGNPDHAGFGALRFQADAPGEVFAGWQHAAAHKAYFHPGSQALGNMTRIATGHYTAVTRAADEARLLSNPVDLGWRFDPAEARDAHGEWTRGGAGYTAPDPEEGFPVNYGTTALTNDDIEWIIELGWQDQPRNSRGEWTRFGGVNEAADVMMKNREGFSVSVRSGKGPAHGYMVAQTGHTHTYPASILDDHMALTRAIDDMLVQEKSAFRGGDTYLGGWVHDGKLWLEPSDNIASREQAVREGTSRNQIAIWDVDDGQEIQTGGSGGGRIIEHANTQGGGRPYTGGLRGSGRGPEAGVRLGPGLGDPAGTILGQLVDLGWQGWRTEPRDRHGRWTRLPGEADEAAPVDKHAVADKLAKLANYAFMNDWSDEERYLSRALIALNGGMDKEAVTALRTAARNADKKRGHDRAVQYGALADQLRGLPPSAESVTARTITDFVGKARDVVPGLVGGSHEEWNGHVTLFRAQDDPGILAAMRWNGTMNVQDTLARHIQYGLAHPDQPISDPAAFSVPLHELIHGTVPPGSAEANMHAYQEYPKAQIEEGFTELGTVHHAPEFFDKMGIGDRETAMTATDAEAAYRANGNRPVISWGPAKPEVTMSKALSDVHLLSLNYSFPFIRTVDQALRQGDVDTAISSLDNAVPGLPDNHPARRDVLGILSELRSMTSQPGVRHATMTEYARRLQDPARVAAGDAWGHYPDQTKSAQDWVQQIAMEEGHADLRPGTDGWKRVVALADEVNQHGAASKIPVMARQMVRALVKDPKMAANPVFVNDLAASIEANIIKAWEGDTATAAKAAYAGSKQVARTKMMEQMRQAA